MVIIKCVGICIKYLFQTKVNKMYLIKWEMRKFYAYALHLSCAFILPKNNAIVVPSVW